MRTSRSELTKRLPDDWIVGQQLGLLAYALTQFHLQEADRARLLIELDARIREFNSLGTPSNTLPLSALYALSQPRFFGGLPKEDRELLSEWRARYSEVATGHWESSEKPRPSQINGAKLIAHQVLYSDARPRAVANAASAFLSDEFEGLASSKHDLQTLEGTLKLVRTGAAATPLLLIGISQITDVLRKYSIASLLVRNALFDHVLAWPLLVCGEGVARIGAISLPVAVDLSFNGLDQVTFEARGSDPKKNILLDGWMSHLRVAANVGKALWRGKNGNTGQWRDEVLRASVAFDFTAIDEISDGAGLTPELADRSMEAYFAQVVLAKAIGRHAGLTAAVTGSIGAQRAIQLSSEQPAAMDTRLRDSAPVEADASDDDVPPIIEERTVLDWNFERGFDQKGDEQKQKFVFGSFKFDRFVLPGARRRLSGRQVGEHGYVETNYCRFLSDVSDCVQVGGWRQFKYVRCPDVAHVMHRYAEELPKFDSDESIACAGLLSGSHSPILQLPTRINVAHLLSTLRHINFERRLADSSPAPTLSWLVLRAIPEELDTRFWHMLLRSIGALRHDYHRMRLEWDSNTAASIVRDALNRLTPDESTRERAPDIVIVLGCKHVRVAQDVETLADTRPLAFEAVMKPLAQETIDPVQNKRLREFVGATRLVLVESDDQVGAPAPSRWRLNDANRALIERLKTFRFGFTQQMASICLGEQSSQKQVRSKLNALCRAGFVSYGGGWHRVRMLPPITSAARIRDSLALAVDHLSAGMAFTPYLTKSSFPGLNIAEALLPQHVREATYHFERAAHFANEMLLRESKEQEERHKLATAVRHQARTAQHRCILFFDVPTLGTVNQLAKNRALMPALETYQLAQEMISDQKENGKTPGPMSLSVLARAATQLLQETIRENKSDQAEHLLRVIHQTYQDALTHAEDHRFAPEVRLDVLTRYASFIHRFGKTNEEKSTLVEYDRQIVSQLEAGIYGFGMWGEWFALYGDGIRDAKEAVKFYHLGVKYCPRYHANYPRWLGAAMFAGRGKPSLHADLAQYESEHVAELARWAEGQKWPNQIDRRKRRYVVERFIAGKDFLLANVAHRR